jgi:hypothetical protein
MMDFEHVAPGKEAEGFLEDMEIEEADSTNPPQGEEIFRPDAPRTVYGEHGRTESREIYARVMDLGKLEAQAGEFVIADMKPRWLVCVLATMCAVEEHGRSGMVETLEA